MTNTQPLIEEISHYFLVQNHTKGETAKYFGITILEFKEIMVKYNLDKTAFRQNMRASAGPGIITEISVEEINEYLALWEHFPANLNAFKHYIENNEIVINADSKFERVAVPFEFRKYGREMVAV
jgi:hypothetical protein